MLLRLLPIFLALVPIGHFNQPVYVTSPPHAKHTLIVVERYGRIRAVVRGHVQRKLLADLRSRVLVDDPRRGGRPARAVLDRLPARLPAQPALLRRLRRPRRPPADRRAAPRQHARVRHVLDLGPVGHPAPRRPAPVRPRRAAVREHRAWATARDVGQILRFDPRHPQPEVYAHRPAQPVALLVRPDRRAADRRRRRPRLGGGRRASPPGAAARHRLRLARLRGPGRRRRRRPRSPTATATAGARSPAATCDAAAATSTATSAPASCGARASPAPRSTTTARSGVTVHYLVSFGRDARGRLYAVSFGGARVSACLLGHEPERAERRQRDLRRERLVVPRRSARPRRRRRLPMSEPP